MWAARRQFLALLAAALTLGVARGHRGIDDGLVDMLAVDGAGHLLGRRGQPARRAAQTEGLNASDPYNVSFSLRSPSGKSATLNLSVEVTSKSGEDMKAVVAPCQDAPSGLAELPFLPLLPVAATAGKALVGAIANGGGPSKAEEQAKRKAEEQAKKQVKMAQDEKAKALDAQAAAEEAKAKVEEQAEEQVKMAQDEKAKALDAQAAAEEAKAKAEEALATAEEQIKQEQTKTKAALADEGFQKAKYQKLLIETEAAKGKSQKLLGIIFVLLLLVFVCVVLGGCAWWKGVCSFA